MIKFKSITDDQLATVSHILRLTIDGMGIKQYNWAPFHTYDQTLCWDRSISLFLSFIPFKCLFFYGFGKAMRKI